MRALTIMALGSISLASLALPIQHDNNCNLLQPAIVSVKSTDGSTFKLIHDYSHGATNTFQQTTKHPAASHKLTFTTSDLCRTADNEPPTEREITIEVKGHTMCSWVLRQKFDGTSWWSSWTEDGGDASEACHGTFKAHGNQIELTFTPAEDWARGPKK